MTEPQIDCVHKPLLTRREYEVLQLLFQGLTSQEAAQRLFVAKRTIDFHVSNAYDKLHVHTRMEAFRAMQSLPPRVIHYGRETEIRQFAKALRQTTSEVDMAALSAQIEAMLTRMNKEALRLQRILARYEAVRCQLRHVCSEPEEPPHPSRAFNFDEFIEGLRKPGSEPSDADLQQKQCEQSSNCEATK